MNRPVAPPPATGLEPARPAGFGRLLRNELWKLFGKKRTYIGFVMFLLAQNLIALVFKLTRASAPMQRMLETAGHAAEAYLSVLTIATIMLVPVAAFLLPLYVALVGGDLVAKEAEDGTLRMILSRPVSRVRLLAVKWVAGAVFGLSLCLALGVFGLVFARLYFPWGGLFVWMPEQQIFGVFDATSGLYRYLAAHLMLVTEAASIMGLAFMFSCFNVKPAAATILGLSVIFVSFILEHIPYFAEYRDWFLTWHLHLWQYMFAERVPWWRVGQSLSLLVGFNATFFAVGAAVFHARDIKS
jgi:ABC-2 type transport system permease protein